MFYVKRYSYILTPARHKLARKAIRKQKTLTENPWIKLSCESAKPYPSYEFIEFQQSCQATTTARRNPVQRRVQKPMGLCQDERYDIHLRTKSCFPDTKFVQNSHFCRYTTLGTISTRKTARLFARPRPECTLSLTSNKHSSHLFCCW